MNHLKRFPRYKQQNASDCGPTSLRTIALSPSRTKDCINECCQISTGELRLNQASTSSAQDLDK